MNAPNPESTPQAELPIIHLFPNTSERLTPADRIARKARLSQHNARAQQRLMDARLAAPEVPA